MIINSLKDVILTFILPEGTIKNKFSFRTMTWQVEKFYTTTFNIKPKLVQSNLGLFYVSGANMSKNKYIGKNNS